MSHFTCLQRWLHVTNLFEFSLLFHKQWRNHPAVAIDVLIIHAYTRRADLFAQDADVAPTVVSVSYLRFMRMWKPTPELYTHITDTFAHASKTS